MSIFDSVKSFLFEPSQPVQPKSASGGIFGFFNNISLPKMGEKEQLKAYHEWVYACTNAIAERVADIDLKLQTKYSYINWWRFGELSTIFMVFHP